MATLIEQGIPSAIGGGIGPTNGAKQYIETEIPYIVRATLTGTTDLLFHKWNCEAVEEKSNAAKGSEAKKTDNIESYVSRNEDNVICVPSEYIRMSINYAAKFRQDPRSPRKSAMDLYKAAIVPLEELCPIVNVVGELPKTWDYLHKCRVQVQRNGITRVRPAFLKGYRVHVELLCNLPQYITPHDLSDVLVNAGKLVGIGDFRPSHGRFQVDHFEVAQ